MNINEARCPECASRFKVGAHPHKGQHLICPLCETNLTITSLNPVELDVTMPANYALRPKKKSSIIEVPCPECENFLRINPHAHQGYRVRCSHCDTTLEVVSTNPLELDVALTARHTYMPRDTLDEEPRHLTKKVGRARRESK